MGIAHQHKQLCGRDADHNLDGNAVEYGYGDVHRDLDVYVDVYRDADIYGDGYSYGIARMYSG